MPDDSEEVGKTVETKVVVGIPPRLERTVTKVYAKKPKFQRKSRAQQLDKLLRGKPKRRRRNLKVTVGNKEFRLTA